MCREGCHGESAPSETESAPTDKPPADLLAAAHEDVDVLAIAEITLDGPEVFAARLLKAHVAIDRAVGGLLRRCCAMEKQALSKRDAEWREAAKEECSELELRDEPFHHTRCSACRTVARMEGKEG
jgi:hypothetical protein